MSNRKRICVITAQVEESTQNRFMQGFLKQAYDMNYDVCIFSMFLKYQDSTDREVGDSNIYNLINFNLFDAVVLCQDTIQTPGVVEKLEKRLQSEFANGVVVVVGYTVFFLFLPEKTGKRTKSENLVRFLLFWTIFRKIFSQTRLLCLEHIESGIIVSARHILSDYLSRRCVAGDESEVHQLIAIA